MTDKQIPESDTPSPSLPLGDVDPTSSSPEIDIAQLYRQHEWETATSYCNVFVCEAGHTWVATMGAAECPGCKQSALMVRMKMCPVCNEPPRKLKTVVHLTANGQYGPACKGVAAPEEKQAEIEVEL